MISFKFLSYRWETWKLFVETVDRQRSKWKLQWKLFGNSGNLSEGVGIMVSSFLYIGGKQGNSIWQSGKI